MKKYLVFAAAASLFAACSNDDGAVAGPQQEAQQTAGEVAVAFDSYVNRATTRAGMTGGLTIDNLKEKTYGTSDKKAIGFGVFAYYTDDDLYSPIYLPNFMYNTKVSKSTTDWTYNPVRYWRPNGEIHGFVLHQQAGRPDMGNSRYRKCYLGPKEDDNRKHSN